MASPVEIGSFVKHSKLLEVVVLTAMMAVLGNGHYNSELDVLKNCVLKNVVEYSAGDGLAMVYESMLVNSFVFLTAPNCHKANMSNV